MGTAVVNTHRDVDPNQKMRKAQCKALCTVRISIDGHNIIVKEEELGGMRDAVGVCHPGRDPEDGHVQHAPGFWRKILDLAIG